VIEQCYREFLLQNHDAEEREYAGHGGIEGMRELHGVLVSSYKDNDANSMA